MYDVGPGKHAGRKILLADDDPGSLEGLRFLLESWGYVVATAPNGAAALSRLPAVAPALVITDLIMPEMTGLDLLESIQRGGPVVPVIIMTAHGNLEYRRRAVEKGAAAFLSKPVDVGRLRTLLRSLFHEDNGTETS